jgi:hypothetical protein
MAAACLAGVGLAAVTGAETAYSQNRPAAKGPQQVVNPAPVTYWMDVATGASGSQGGGMMGGMMAGMMGGGGAGFDTRAWGGRDNWFGAANAASPGPRVDIAVFDRRRPGQVTATQAIPPGMKLGASLPINPPPPVERGSPFEERDPEPPEMPEERMRMTIKAYWGCGPTVRPGQPRTQTFEIGGPNGMAMYGQTVQGRFERDRGATSNNRSSIWPNQRSNTSPPRDSSLLGEHRVTGEGLPASLAFTLGPPQNFMPPMGLRASGAQSGVITLGWSNIATASAYFAAANGFAMKQGATEDDNEMILITWSASELPESGQGLINYLSNANQDRYLRDKVILPAGTTQCQIPSGIFADAMMVNISGIAYGRELNLVHPPRPADPRQPWNQEWTARVRVKSQASVMMMGGMGGMAGMGGGREAPAAEAPAARGGGRAAQAAAPAAPAPGQPLPKCKGDGTGAVVAGAGAEAAGSATWGSGAGRALWAAGRALSAAGQARQRQAAQEQPGVTCEP